MYCKPLERNKLGQKQCNVCKQWKDEIYFSKNRSAKDGLQACCKSCQKEQVRLSRKKNKTNSYMPKSIVRNELGQKQCSKCLQWKDEVEFSGKINSKDGLNTICKSCQHDYDIARSKQRKEERQKLNNQRKLEQRKFNKKGQLLQQCYHCKEYKILTVDFNVDKRNFNGYSGVCKDCGKKQKEEYLKSLNPEEKERRRLNKNQQQKIYREQHKNEINAKKRKEI